MSNLRILSVIVLSLSAGLSSGCASSPKTSESAVSPISVEPIGAKQIWKQQFPGLIADLDRSNLTGRTLISTVPNYDREDGAREYRSYLVSAAGAIEASVVQPFRVRAQSISEEGERWVTANYEDQLAAFDGSGKKLWEIDAHCRPRLLNHLHEILCTHDDDVKPGVAFEIFTWEGKPVSKYAVTGDALSLEVSRDEQNTALALTGGQIHLLKADLKRAWSQKVDGEALDVAVTDGADPRVYALVLGKAKDSEIVVFSSQGKRIASFSSATHAYQQIGVAPDGSGVLLLGNGSTGQILSFYALVKDEKEFHLEHRWSRREATQADYSSPLVIGESSVLFGTEKTDETARRLTRVSAFSIGSGDALWSIPIPTDEGATLFHDRKEATGGSTVVIANDSGLLMGFLAGENK